MTAVAQPETGKPADTPWPMYQHDPQHTGRSSLLGPIQKPELLWTADLLPCAGGLGGISITNDGTLMIDVGGCLENFDPQTRQFRWIHQIGVSNRSAPLIASDDYIYWGVGWSFVQTTPDGSLGWIVDLDPNCAFMSSPTFGSDGNLYFVHDGVWSFTTDGVFRWLIPYGDVGSQASPAIGIDGNIYAGTDYANGDICSYTSSGSVQWCRDIPGVAFDRTVSVGQDGTIFIPTDGNSESPDSGVLVALDPSGNLKWKFQPGETAIFGIPDGIAIGPDGSIRFGSNLTSQGESYLYSISSNGDFQWKTPFTINPLTGLSPWLRTPITIDREGNSYLCIDNSHCYGFDNNGNQLWDFEFSLADSVITAAATQPVIAQDGLFFLVDYHEKLYAFADGSLYPILKTSVSKLEYSVALGSPEFSASIPITSTSTPITFTATISPSQAWLSISNPIGITPAEVNVQVDPAALPSGVFHGSVIINPEGSILPNITIPISLTSGLTPFYLPQISYLGQSNQILFTSQWFTENQLASIDRSGVDREVITHTLPSQIDMAAYSPDGRYVALVQFIDGDHQINIVNTKTGDTDLIIDDLGPVGCPAWSSDSQHIAFCSTLYDPYNSEIIVIDLDGRNLTRLTYTDNLSEGQSFWSPDDNKIVVDLGGIVYLMNSNGTDYHKVITGHFSDFIQDWSPDGKHILLGSQLKNSADWPVLGVYDLETGAYVILAQNFSSGAQWSPDGSTIAYTGYNPGDLYDWDIFVVNQDGTGQRNLTHGLDNEDSLPSWSPNSQWLVFASRSDASYNDPNYDIFVIKANGTGLQQVTKNIQADYYPFWKP